MEACRSGLPAAIGMNRGREAAPTRSRARRKNDSGRAGRLPCCGAQSIFRRRVHATPVNALIPKRFFGGCYWHAACYGA